MAGSTKRCLIVDESAVVRKAARRILEDLDFLVQEAEDGTRALEMCAASMPSVIFVDEEIPILNGVAFVASLRTAGVAERPKAVFCAREGDTVTIARAMRAGADGYLVKPYDRLAITAKLEDIGLI
ncbi:MAG: response regulator [Hyphomicrobiales bacterium]|nr:response regulator [Hyphomicrobiales bacterium]